MTLRIRIMGNVDVINKAFKRYILHVMQGLKNGMTTLLRECADEALARHKHDGKPTHTKAPESYGWLLLHNGKEVAHWTNSGSRTSWEADALTKLRSEAKSCPGKGFCGIYLVDMDVHEGDAGRNPRRLDDVWETQMITNSLIHDIIMKRDVF